MHAFLYWLSNWKIWRNILDFTTPWISVRWPRWLVPWLGLKALNYFFVRFNTIKIKRSYRTKVVGSRGRTSSLSASTSSVWKAGRFLCVFRKSAISTWTFHEYSVSSHLSHNPAVRTKIWIECIGSLRIEAQHKFSLWTASCSLTWRRVQDKWGNALKKATATNPADSVGPKGWAPPTVQKHYI